MVTKKTGRATPDFEDNRSWAKGYLEGTSGGPVLYIPLAGNWCSAEDFVKYHKELKGGADTPRLLQFIKLTGPLPKRADKRKEITELLGPSFKGGIFDQVIHYLDTLKEWAAYENLAAEYKKGTISKALLDLLLENSAWPEDYFTAAGPGGLLYKMISEGQLDFKPFQGKEDKEQNWYLKYRIAFQPLPNIRKSIDRLEAIGPRMKAEALAHLQTQVKLLLQADKTPAATREALERMAEAIERQYNARIKEKTGRDFSAPFIRPQDTGFYINPETRKINDLRPYQAELHSLLSVSSWDYLKDYAEALRKAATAERGELVEGLFSGNDFVPLRNTPETLAISAMTTGISPLYFQPSLPGLDGMAEHTTELMINRENNPRAALQIKIKDKPNSRGLRPSTQKVKTLLEAVYTQRRKGIFAFSIRDYMRLCEPGKPEDYYTGVRYRKFAAKLREDLRTLYNTSFTANYKGLSPGEIRLLDGWTPGPNGSIEISLGGIYCRELLARGGISQICRTFWQSDERNPHVIPFLLKLCGNRSNTKNIIKGGQRANTISLKALFDFDSRNFPPLEKVKKSRRYRELLIEPIIKTIAQLNDEGHIISRYVDPDHKEYTAEDLSLVSFSDFMDSHKWLLEYELCGFTEDTQAVIEARERLQKKTRAKRKKKTE